MISFADTIKKGKIGERIFKEDFLDFLNINYVDVTGCQQFQAIDSDYLSTIGLYEIKTNYKDDGLLIIEEYTNCNEKLGPISLGWWYKSKADLLVFISKMTRTMVFVPFNNAIKQKYQSIRNNYKLLKNQYSVHNNHKWQSAFRKIPLSAIEGYYSIYKRIGTKNISKEVSL